MKMYIARDGRGNLLIFHHKPSRVYIKEANWTIWVDYSVPSGLDLTKVSPCLKPYAMFDLGYGIPNNSFSHSEISVKDEPKEVEINFKGYIEALQKDLKRAEDLLRS